jgi:uncharacterized protein
VTDTIRIDWGEGEVTGRLAGAGGTGILLAHGAGTDQEHPFIVLLRDGLAAGGFTVLTFNYPYTERGARRPDPQARLVTCHRAAAEELASRADRVVLAGRSMGGRMGTYLAAEGFDALALVLYAYPLHPAGKPDRLRVSQFPEISIPMLFFQGTRDALARMDLFDRHIAPLPNATVEILDGASHATRGGGWTDETMSAHLVAKTTEWVGALR